MSRRNRRPRLRSFYVWHRWIGGVVVLFVLLAAVTGVLLNHTEPLRLDQRRVTWPPLLAWYGFEAPFGMAWRAGEQWVSHWGTRLYLGDVAAADSPEPPVGAVATRELIAVAEPGRVLLLSPAGQLIDVLGGVTERAGAITDIGIDDRGFAVLRLERALLRPDAEWVSWQPVTERTAVRWSRPEPLPATLQASVATQFHGEGLPLERVVLDLHSGRLLGSWGPWLFDLLALLLLFNAVSGVWLWLGRGRKGAPDQPADRSEAPPPVRYTGGPLRATGRDGS